MTLRGGLQRLDIGLFVTDIRHSDIGFPAQGVDFFLNALQRLDAAPAQHHRGALFGKAQRGGLTDAGTGASDEGDFSL